MQKYGLEAGRFFTQERRKMSSFFLIFLKRDLNYGFYADEPRMTNDEGNDSIELSKRVALS